MAKENKLTIFEGMLAKFAKKNVQLEGLDTLDTMSFFDYLIHLAAVVSKKAEIHQKLDTTFQEVGMDLWLSCPSCESPVLLEYKECPYCEAHLMGAKHAEPNVVNAAPEPKEAPAAVEVVKPAKSNKKSKEEAAAKEAEKAAINEKIEKAKEKVSKKIEAEKAEVEQPAPAVETKQTEETEEETLPSADEINKMSEKDLKGIIAKYELKVDTKLKINHMRKAVNEALDKLVEDSSEEESASAEVEEPKKETKPAKAAATKSAKSKKTEVPAKEQPKSTEESEPVDSGDGEADADFESSLEDDMDGIEEDLGDDDFDAALEGLDDEESDDDEEDVDITDEEIEDFDLDSAEIEDEESDDDDSDDFDDEEEFD